MAIEWVLDNKKLVFSGVGVAILSGLIGLLRLLAKRKSKAGQTAESVHDSAVIQASGDIKDVTININTTPQDRDRGLLKITAEVFVRTLNPHYPIDDLRTVATITNIGECPISVMRWCICQHSITGDDTQDFVIHIKPPKKLEPADSFVREGPGIENPYYPAPPGSQPKPIRLRSINTIYVMDSTGERWDMKQEELEKFKEESKQKIFNLERKYRDA